MPFPTAFPTRKAELEFLVAECERSRECHVWWIKIIEDGTAYKKALDHVGNLEHHRYHVRKYNALIRILKTTAAHLWIIQERKP